MSLFKSIIQKFPHLYILAKSPNVKIANLNIKAYNLIKKHNLFDEEYYLRENKNLKNIDFDPLLHYIFFGFQEGKDPNSNFDSFFYLNEYMKDSKLNPLIHYTLYGLNDKRKTKLSENKLNQLSSGEIDTVLNENNYSSNFKNTKKRILYVLHEKISVLGGTGYINQDIIGEVKDDYEPYILTSNKSLMELWKVNGDELEKLANFNLKFKKPAIIHDYNNENNSNDLENYFYNTELRDIYFNILFDLKIDLIHINHLINHSYDLIDLAKSFNIPYILNVHDFYYFCPSTHLLNKKNNYCEVFCKNNDFSCNISENLEKIIDKWRNYSIKAINDSYLTIFPSEFSLNFYINNLKELKSEKLQVITPGRDFKSSNESFTLPNKFPVKILCPGHLTPHKGSLLIKNIKKLDKNNKIEFHFLGTSMPSLKEYGVNHGRYEREKMETYLNSIKPSFIGLFSTSPETYSHTLTESWNSKIPVIATNLGAFKERINKTNGGFLVDYESPQKIYDEILNISQNKEKYLEIVKNIKKIKVKSRKEMFNEYKNIYNDLIND